MISLQGSTAVSESERVSACRWSQVVLDIKAKEKLSAETAGMNVEKIRNLQPKKSFQAIGLSDKHPSRVPGIISLLNNVDGKSYLKGQL